MAEQRPAFLRRSCNRPDEQRQGQRVTVGARHHHRIRLQPPAQRQQRAFHLTALAPLRSHTAIKPHRSSITTDATRATCWRQRTRTRNAPTDTKSVLATHWRSSRRRTRNALEPSRGTLATHRRRSRNVSTTDRWPMTSALGGACDRLDSIGRRTPNFTVTACRAGRVR